MIGALLELGVGMEAQRAAPGFGNEILHLPAGPSRIDLGELIVPQHQGGHAGLRGPGSGEMGEPHQGDLQDGGCDSLLGRLRHPQPGGDRQIEQHEAEDGVEGDQGQCGIASPEALKGSRGSSFPGCPRPEEAHGQAQASHDHHQPLAFAEPRLADLQQVSPETKEEEGEGQETESPEEELPRIREHGHGGTLSQEAKERAHRVGSPRKQKARLLV